MQAYTLLTLMFAPGLGAPGLSRAALRQTDRHTKGSAHVLEPRLYVCMYVCKYVDELLRVVYVYTYMYTFVCILYVCKHVSVYECVRWRKDITGM